MVLNPSFKFIALVYKAYSSSCLQMFTVVKISLWSGWIISLGAAEDGLKMVEMIIFLSPWILLAPLHLAVFLLQIEPSQTHQS